VRPNRSANKRGKWGISSESGELGLGGVKRLNNRKKPLAKYGESGTKIRYTQVGFPRGKQET